MLNPCQAEWQIINQTGESFPLEIKCVKRISVSKHKKCDGFSAVQTVQLKQLLFICGKLQNGNGFLQCYQISHNTRIRWGFFFSSWLLFSDKYKVQGGRASKVNERIKAPRKKKLVKKPGHDAHTVVCLSRDTNQV